MSSSASTRRICRWRRTGSCEFLAGLILTAGGKRLARRKNFRRSPRINAADEMSFAANNMLFEANIKFLPLPKNYFGKQHFFAAVNICSEAFPAKKWRDFLENRIKLD